MCEARFALSSTAKPGAIPLFGGNSLSFMQADQQHPLMTI
jgi:hypothetical protein